MVTEIIKTTCDRCGKEIPDWVSQSFRLYKRKFIMTRGPYSEQKEMDLCKECYESLIDWYYRKESENK